MISFIVTIFFTNVPMEETITIILDKLYDEKKIETNIPPNIMQDLLYSCTKHVHFTSNDKIYIQEDGVAMGSAGSTVGEHFYDSATRSCTTNH